MVTLKEKGSRVSNQTRSRQREIDLGFIIGGVISAYLSIGTLTHRNTDSCWISRFKRSLENSVDTMLQRAREFALSKQLDEANKTM